MSAAELILVRDSRRARGRGLRLLSLSAPSTPLKALALFARLADRAGRREARPAVQQNQAPRPPGRTPSIRSHTQDNPREGGRQTQRLQAEITHPTHIARRSLALPWLRDGDSKRYASTSYS